MVQYPFHREPLIPNHIGPHLQNLLPASNGHRIGGQPFLYCPVKGPLQRDMTLIRHHSVMHAHPETLILNHGALEIAQRHPQQVGYFP